MKLQAIASFFLLVCSTSTSKASTVHEACQSLTAEHHKPAEHHKHPAEHHKHTISYHDCVKFFQADKGSATADKRGLAAIGAKIIGATAKSVSDRIAHLRASEKDKELSDCLNKCSKLYSGAAADIGKVAKGIASGTNGTLGDAATTLGSVLDAPSTCEEGFKKIHKPSPLATEDAKFHKEVAITLLVTGTL